MRNSVKALTRHDLVKHRKAASMTIDAAAAAFTTRLGRLITVNIVAGWENGFIAVPKDVSLDMLQPVNPGAIPTATDTKVLWEQIEPRLRPSVIAASIAMCQLRDPGEEHTACPCITGGRKLCHAYTLFGREATAAVVATDQVQQGLLHAGVYAVQWQRGDT